MFQLLYHPRTTKFTKRLSRKQKARIVGKTKKLALDPFSPTLDIKKLINTRSSYRLRIGDVRVIFETDQKAKIIYIQKIGFRGGIY